MALYLGFDSSTQSLTATVIDAGNGTRRVVALVLRSSTVQIILEHLRLSSGPLPLAPATSSPQLGLW